MMQEKALLVSSTEKGRALLQTLLPPDMFSSVQLCQSGVEARRECAQTEYAMVLINTPLTDESGLDLAMELAGQTDAGVLLIVKSELAETVAIRVERYGVLVIPKPVVRVQFDQALRFAMAMRSRMQALREENARLQKKLAEQRLVDRAKFVLIQYLGMTEEQAHRYIEKQAMDTRQTKVAVAQTIISTYEL